MVSEEVQDHERFVRNDVSGIALTVFLFGVYFGVTKSIVYFLGAFSLGLVAVGVSVAWEWRKELISNDYVEIAPLQTVLIGTTFLIVLQILFGFFGFYFTILKSILYGLMSGAGYLLLVLYTAHHELPGDDYVTKTHPTENRGGITYVFNEEYYISLIEEEALRKANQDETSDEL